MIITTFRYFKCDVRLQGLLHRASVVPPDRARASWPKSSVVTHAVSPRHDRASVVTLKEFRRASVVTVSRAGHDVPGRSLARARPRHDRVNPWIYELLQRNKSHARAEMKEAELEFV